MCFSLFKAGLYVLIIFLRTLNVLINIVIIEENLSSQPY